MPESMPFDWQDHINAGQQYLKTAHNGLKRPSVFNNTLIYQLVAMAIEKLLVGVYQYHHQMPVDHTLDGLVDDLTTISPLDQDLADRIKGFGRFDDMCPIIPVGRHLPDDIEIKAVLAAGRQVADYARHQVKAAAD